ncbi:MAG: hypothetical protein ACREMV_13880, partial [Gemmatimonadales bacterium]
EATAQVERRASALAGELIVCDPKLWHTDEERVPVADLVACARALAHAVLRHLAAGPRRGRRGSA